MTITVCAKESFSLELDKEPYQIAVSQKKAAVDTANADLQAAIAQRARY